MTEEDYRWSLQYSTKKNHTIPESGDCKTLTNKWKCKAYISEIWCTAFSDPAVAKNIQEITRMSLLKPYNLNVHKAKPL